MINPSICLLYNESFVFKNFIVGVKLILQKMGFKNVFVNLKWDEINSVFSNHKVNNIILVDKFVETNLLKEYKEKVKYAYFMKLNWLFACIWEYKIIPFKRWFIDLSEKILESSWFLESEPGGDVHIKLRKIYY